MVFFFFFSLLRLVPVIYLLFVVFMCVQIDKKKKTKKRNCKCENHRNTLWELPKSQHRFTGLNTSFVGLQQINAKHPSPPLAVFLLSLSNPIKALLISLILPFLIYNSHFLLCNNGRFASS